MPVGVELESPKIAVVLSSLKSAEAELVRALVRDIRRLEEALTALQATVDALSP